VAKAASKKASSGKKSAPPARLPAKKPSKPVEKVAKKPAAKVVPARSKPVPAKVVASSKAPSRRETQSVRKAAAPDAGRSHGLNNGGPILAPVPTNDKPRKNQAGFSPKELEHFRDILLAKRREILGDMSAMEREALRTSGSSNLSTLPIHMADMGTDNYEQEFTLGLVETERKLLREINNALAKIQNGSFGICEGTGRPINKARLEVQPWAKFSIEYAKQMERGGRPIP
jgi:DnaK suppressor protein